MDYTIFENKIISFYAIIIFFSLLSFLIILILGFKKLPIILSKYRLSKKYIKLLLILYVSITLVIGLFLSRNYLLDLNLVKERKFIIDEVTAITSDLRGDTGEIREIKFLNSEDRVISINFVYGEVKKDEKYIIMYLPNTHIGAIVQKLE